MKRWLGVAVLAVAILLSTSLPAQASVPRRGLVDDLSFTDYRSDVQRAALARARSAGARLVRITVDWSIVAPAGAVKPAGFDAADPSADGYNWSYVDDAVRAARERGLGVILTVVRAPAWAEGPGKPAASGRGAWRPDPAELGSFVRAAARRFSGFYPDPKNLGGGGGILGDGKALPRVRYWQIWDEPNAGRRLQPVYEGGRLVAAEHYRLMLNASAAALRALDGTVLITAGTSARRERGAPPLAFWRDLLCITRGGGRAPCPERARFQVAAHNPRTSRKPSLDLRRDELGVSQLSSLSELVGRAVSLRTVSPARRKQLWVTEIGWDTPPLDPGGTSPRLQARYLSESLYQSQLAGAKVVVWAGVQDRVTYLPGVFGSIASGLFTDDAASPAPKPSLAAFRFPFVVKPAPGGSLVWGIAPKPSSAVVVEQRSGRRWSTVARLRPRRSGELRARLDRGSGLYRARQGRVASPAWRR